MKAGNDVRSWARTVEVSDPICWGELEGKVLEFPVTDEEIREAENTPAGPSRLAVVFALLFGSPFYLGALAGLVLVIIAVSVEDAATRDELIAWAHLPGVIALILIIAQGIIWFEGRDRSTLSVVIIGSLTAVYLVAYLLVRPLPGASWTALISLGAVVLGAVVLFLVLFRSKLSAPGPRVKLATCSPEQKVQMGRRAVLLEELKKRELITDRNTDIAGLVEMPLGSWHRMDERLRR